MTVSWDKELGEKCGETWALRGTTLSCAAVPQAARKLVADMDAVPITVEPLVSTTDAAARVRQLQHLVGREYSGEYICNFATRPGTPEAVLNPTTHLTFSYAAQVVLLDDQGRLERVVVANDVGRAINPRLCAEQMDGGSTWGSATRCPRTSRPRVASPTRWDCATSASCRRSTCLKST
jgi:CO/xanthine dehydrogenase Mo-binding subunit